MSKETQRLMQMCECDGMEDTREMDSGFIASKAVTFPEDHKRVHRVYTLFGQGCTATMLGTRQDHAINTKMTKAPPLLSTIYP